MKRFSRAFALLLVCSGGLAACKPAGASEPVAGYTVAGDTITLRAESPVRFETTELRWSDPLPAAQVAARVTTPEARTSPSFAPLPGRVVETAVHLGDRVRKGDKLVLVRTGELPSLAHDLRAAEVLESTRAASLERLRQLVAAKVGAQHDVMLAESELAQAKLTVSQAKARLAALQVKRVDESSYWVLSGRDGTIVQLDATVGLQVGPERGFPVATVADLSELVVVADLPQRDAHDVHPGMATQVFAQADSAEPIDGEVMVVAEVVDPDRQTVPVRIRVTNAQRILRPGAFVDVSFTPEPGQRLVLPASSVVRDGDLKVVFVEVHPGVFEKREVRLGRRAHTRVEVASGLTVGERVVTSSALLLLHALSAKGQS